MIIVTRVSYKNFLASGNHPTTIPLNQYPSTLVIGPNGVGKSTMTEAICFAWFGKPLRNVRKKAGLVNADNKRECLVELDWTGATGQSYRVRRGLNPAVFEIYENQTLLPVPPNVADYQAQLERLVGLNHKSFMQIVVLANTNFVPFMRLPAAARREIIEDLLDIEVFSTMMALAKDDVNRLKMATDATLAKRNLLTEQVRMAQSFTTQLEAQRTDQLNAIDAEITTTLMELDAVTTDRTSSEGKLAKYEPVRTALSDLLTQQRGFEHTLTALRARAAKYTQERSFYQSHDHCPTCEQSITEGFKEERYATLTQKEAHTTQAMAQCESDIAKCRQHAANAQRLLDGAEVVKQRLYSLDTQIRMHQSRLADLRRQRERVVDLPVTPTVDVAALEAQLQAVQTEYDKQAQDRVVLDAATLLLKDHGIKTRVVRHFLPIINRFINQHLKSLEFPIQFRFNEQFEEEIKSRGRDFTYEQFSSGERMRIDLALLLTWRAVAKLKNSASTNLLILDEVFDSSLDTAGIDCFLNLMKTFESSNVNVIVISHKSDQMIDKFSHTLTFQKQRGFSQLVSAS